MARKNRCRADVRQEAVQWSKEQTFSTAMKTSPENVIYCFPSKLVMASVAYEGESEIVGPLYSLNYFHIEKDGRVTHEGAPTITKNALMQHLHRAGIHLTTRIWKYPVVTDDRSFDTSRGLPLTQRGNGGFELLSVTVTPATDSSDGEGGTAVPLDLGAEPSA